MALPYPGVPPLPYGSRGPQPTFGGKPGFYRPDAAFNPGLTGGVLGALGGAFGCLLCLASIGGLGLFSCIVAVTAYAQNFLNAYKQANGISGAPTQLQISFVLLFASLFYTMILRTKRS